MIEAIGSYLAVGIVYVLAHCLYADKDFINDMIKDNRGLPHNLVVVIVAFSLVCVASAWPIIVIHKFLQQVMRAIRLIKKQ